ncbi:LysE family translocator [Solimonas marina]|uniref:LysE family translocator n=1 Tax=Solimonas marina TaxID=2714601 RepID=A0A969W612_9GAMM|nr:LysE family translocator [Solimonas marina]NKF21212.1 LysE family translocator [Solimonas marina]
MTTWQALLLFTAAAGLLTITPGLDTMLVLRTAIAGNSRAALLAGAGICSGCLVWGLLVSAGLGAVFSVSAIAYDVLRIAGAVYLLWLGAQLLLKPRDSVAAAPSPAVPSDAQSFRRGLLTNLLNPKVGVFYVSFLPQFIPAGVNLVAFGSLLAAIHALLGVLWFAALTLATRPLSRWLRRPMLVRALDRGTGAVFVLFGLRLATSGRPA